VHADAALYGVKAAAGGFALYDPIRHRQFLDRHQLEVELRAASARGEFVLHYQPVVELASRRTVGVEALIRWNHPTRGLLNPPGFIPLAEETGTIVAIGRWVIRQACADARSWQDRIPGAEHVWVAVNVSRRQLHSPAVVDVVSDALTASGLPPASLTVEITETVLMADTGDLVRVLDKLKALGVGLAMDDFGTGYSSLAQMRALPIDVLKIDKVFIDGIARKEEEWALATAIIRLAASFNQRTLAEGVEHASQLAHLRALGCELAQGYLFARPMPLADLEHFLAAGQPPGATSADDVPSP
jgi:EAL domain-containing protein (putative c-di-GMP-specific phosphodiesterase class I)